MRPKNNKSQNRLEPKTLIKTHATLKANLNKMVLKGKVDSLGREVQSWNGTTKEGLSLASTKQTSVRVGTLRRPSPVWRM